MLNNAGREKLLNSLKEENNSTLLNLDTIYSGLNSRSDDPIQSKINTETKWNRIWKRYKNNYGLPAIDLSETKKKIIASVEIEPLCKKKNQEEEEHGKKKISLAIYPILLARGIA